MISGVNWPVIFRSKFDLLFKTQMTFHDEYESNQHCFKRNMLKWECFADASGKIFLTPGVLVPKFICQLQGKINRYIFLIWIKHKLGIMADTCNSSSLEGWGRKSVSSSSRWATELLRSCLKTKDMKRAEEIAYCKGPGINPHYFKNKQTKPLRRPVFNLPWIHLVTYKNAILSFTKSPEY